MATADLREELNCSICLEVFRDPVILKCGHNFCRECIDNVLESQKSQGVFNCPQCRMQFKQRPYLQKNIALANIAEHFHSAPLESKESGTVCTYCIHAAVPASTYCLHCEVSLCADHMRVHTKTQDHMLIEVNGSIEDRKCSVHKKVLDYYCMVDSSCICVSCMQEPKHRGHAVQTLYDASRYKLERLKSILAQLNTEREANEKEVQQLQKSKKEAKDVADQVIQRVTSMFNKLRGKLNILEVQTTNAINLQIEQNSKEVTDLIRQLQINGDELSSKICHIEELCKATDPMTIVEERESNRADFCVTNKGAYKAVPVIAPLDDILISMQLKRDISEILTGALSALEIPPLADLYWDKDVAATNVAVTWDLGTATGTNDMDVEDTDDRFDTHQVMSTSGFLFGQHYWEAGLFDTKSWRIGMAYNSIERYGNEAVLGNTEESWCFCKNQQGYFFRHNGHQIYLRGYYEKFERLGIYLDYDGGRLSFYDIGPQIRHLHTFFATFTEPLYAAVRLGFGVSVTIKKYR